MKMEKYEAPKAVVVDFENDYVVAPPSPVAGVGSGTGFVPDVPVPGHSGGGGGF